VSHAHLYELLSVSLHVATVCLFMSVQIQVHYFFAGLDAYYYTVGGQVILLFFMSRSHINFYTVGSYISMVCRRYVRRQSHPLIQLQDLCCIKLGPLTNGLSKPYLLVYLPASWAARHTTMCLDTVWPGKITVYMLKHCLLFCLVLY